MLAMRTLLLTVMMLCACLSVPGCTGADEEIVCEDTTTLTQYDVYECGFESSGILNSGYTELSIEMTSTGDSSVHIFTFDSDQYDTWAYCEGFDAEDSFSEWYSTGASMEGEIDYDNFYVVFDHPNSCDEEDASTPVAEISFKVVAK